MKCTRHIVFVIVVSLNHTGSLAQNIENHVLKTGERVPDLSLGKMVNYPKSQAKISDFRGKLLILDFWSTWCSVCIEQFPHLAELQHKIGDKLMILPVGFDGIKPGSIEALVKERKGTRREIQLPTAIQSIEDTTISTLFPSQGFPHEIWINGQGILIGITDQRAVTEKNIEIILSGGHADFEEFKLKKTLSPEDPFLISRVARSLHSSYGSVISPYIDSLLPETNRFGTQFDSSVIRLFTINETIYQLYTLAYRCDPSWYSNKRIIVESNGKPFYQNWDQVKQADDREFQDFQRDNLFCYELILPGSYSKNQVYNCMIQDLNRYFRIKSRIEQRYINCYGLVELKSSAAIKSKIDGPANQNTFSEDQLDVIFKNAAPENLVAHLNSILPSLNIINNVKVVRRIDLEIHLDKNYNIMSVRHQLNKYDLDLVPGQRKLDVLVLSTY